MGWGTDGKNKQACLQCPWNRSARAQSSFPGWSVHGEKRRGAAPGLTEESWSLPFRNDGGGLACIPQEGPALPFRVRLI